MAETCDGCVSKFDGEAGPECRRYPKQVVDALWTGALVGYKAYVDASFEERADKGNWCIIAAFPPAGVRCGEYSRRRD